MHRALLTLCLLHAAAAAADEIWRIGEFDDSFAEFAVAGSYRGFPGAFPGEIGFTAGQSAATADWPYIHPGPVDVWAGSRAHPATIEFTLSSAPARPLRFTIDLVDVQSGVPTDLVVDVNGVEGRTRLPAGGGDGSLSDPSLGKEHVVSCVLGPELFVAGRNAITIRTEGSWVTYDALSLSEETSNTPPSIRELAIEPTPLVKRSTEEHGGGRVVVARVTADGAVSEITIRIELRGRPAREETLARGVAFGDAEWEFLVPEASEPTPLTVTARSGGASASATTTLEPVRRMRLFLTPSTHTDIGYTDLQENVIQRHCENTDVAIDLCERYPGFGWNLEVAWQEDVYRERRDPERMERLYALAREGRIGVQAGYLNMLTGLCSHEELNRWLYHAYSLARREGVPFESAVTTDVPTQVWSVPTTLAAAGIRYYANGINNTRGEPWRDVQTPHPWWWEGPDGSRVLAFFSPGYAHAAGPLSSIGELRRWATAAVYGAAVSPYDALCSYGGFSDNVALNPHAAEVADEWARTYEWPKLIVGPQAAYLRYMEEHYGDDLPVLKGDPGVYWEDGAASTARETGLNREAHELASAADALFAVGQTLGLERAPKERLTEVWKNALLFDEHTWGAHNSVSEPDNPWARAQWDVKAQFAHDAYAQGAALVAEGLPGLAGAVRADGRALVLVNPTSWPREGEYVQMSLPEGLTPSDPTTGEPLPTCVVAGERGTEATLIACPTLPAWGYVTCPLVPGETAESRVVPIEGAPVLENAHYRLMFSTEDGSVVSAIDKATGRELVDSSAGRGLNAYLYVGGGDGTSVVSYGAPPFEPEIQPVTRPEIELTELPCVAKVLEIRTSGHRTPSVVSRVTLWDAAARVDFENNLTREEERAKEAVYFAFPFAASDPEVRLEIPNGVTRACQDEPPGGCTEWHCVQHWARVVSPDGGIVWASPDAPLVCVGDINRGLWPREREAANGALYSYVMNNYWFTNYKAGQDGAFRFRYAFTTADAATDAGAARFGWQRSMPVLVEEIPGAQHGPLPSTASLVSVTPGSVMVTAVKPAEVGQALVVRLFSLAEEPVEAVLDVSALPVGQAALANLVEEYERDLPMRGGKVTVTVPPLRPVTVVLR